MVEARGCGYAPVGAGTEMVMDLDHMRDTEKTGQVRLRAKVPGMMELAKGHDRTLGIGMTVQETLLANAADSELVVEQAILPGMVRRFVVGVQERLLWHNSGVVWVQQVRLREAGTGIAPEGLEIVRAYMSRAAMEEALARQLEPDTGTQLVVQETSHGYGSHGARALPRRMLVLRVFSWKQVGATPRVGSMALGSWLQVMGSRGSR